MNRLLPRAALDGHTDRFVLAFCSEASRKRVLAHAIRPEFIFSKRFKHRTRVRALQLVRSVSLTSHFDSFRGGYEVHRSAPLTHNAHVNCHRGIMT